MSLSNYLTQIANAIRAKKGTSDKINAQDFVSEIENLSDEELIFEEIINTSYGEGGTANAQNVRTENWTLTLEDGSIVEKEVVIYDKSN